MLLNLLECIISILAAYGLLSLLLDAADRIRCRVRGRKPNVKVVLLVQNSEDYIEYIVRNAVKRDYVSGVLSDKKLYVVDVNSSDKTYQLLEKLQRNYTGMEVLPYERREQIYEDFAGLRPLKSDLLNI